MQLIKLKALIALLMLSGIIGCGTGGKEEVEIVSSQQVNTYKVKIEKHKDLTVPVSLGIVYQNDKEVFVGLESGVNEYTFETAEIPIGIIAMAQGQAGQIEIGQDSTEIVVILNPITESEDEAPASSLAKTAEYWWGIDGEADTNGDVKFRYMGDFSRFHCSYHLPWLFMSSNPNNWTSWDLLKPPDAFPPPWKGKKLLVPQRYQRWYQIVRGQSINTCLVLIATR